MDDEITRDFLDDARRYYNLLSQRTNNTYVPLRRIQHRRNMEQAKNFCQSNRRQRINSKVSVLDLSVRLEQYMARADGLEETFPPFCPVRSSNSPGM
ncbi:hypothetical protein K7432_003975 [Basidiobolus ranarum]|uniref:Uncharacterized protein n=1 Tax=Basidiobolus ranarum TaxID=34480 RepID=A0ABR2W6A3_9FUNG